MSQETSVGFLEMTEVLEDLEFSLPCIGHWWTDECPVPAVYSLRRMCCGGIVFACSDCSESLLDSTHSEQYRRGCAACHRTPVVFGDRRSLK